MSLAGQNLERKSNLFGVLMRKVTILVISVIKDALCQFAGFCRSAVLRDPVFCVWLLWLGQCFYDTPVSSCVSAVFLLIPKLYSIL